MSAPICPVHGKPMVPSKFGGFYCKTKDGEDWCKEKSSAERPDSSPKRVEKVLENAGWVPANGDARVAAALNFAGRIYSGAGASLDSETADMEQRALLLAERALLMFERKP